ncbi:LacI family DNA-binding transcriptional regulator [Bradyrhizobium sp. PMVTL-01]|uniref:LacI family DNA-binding transcriptional regulator n=1 Tax=Bradyrhizobium sp. PMVTL-01 TaxID=3434999 RepID=UPI003F72EA57
MKPGLNEVAKLAGVGIATVDRVLNERANVSPKTALKVIEAARQLGISRTLPSPHRRLFRVKVIMPSQRTPLLLRLARAFESQIAQTTKSLVIERVLFDERQAEAVPSLIRAAKADAVIVYGPETNQMIDAIASVTSSGTPVITLGSDLPTTPRLAYVGIDHYRAGRAAAFFMSRMVNRGIYLAVCSNLKYRADASRISGFRDGLKAELSSPIHVEIMEGDECPKGMSKDPVSGIYVAGSKNGLAHTVAPWLARAPIVIVHDLSDEVRQMMKTGVVALAIDQNPEEQASRSVALLLARFGLTAHAPEAGIVSFTVHTKYNI